MFKNYNHKQSIDFEINYLISKEILESFLGVKPTKNNICHFASYIEKFEKEIKAQSC